MTRQHSSFQEQSPLVIFDKVSEALLYGQAYLKQIMRSGREQQAYIIRVEAEAYIAFLMNRYVDIPEVKAYLEAIKTEGINPRKGKLLAAVDDAIDIDRLEFLAALEAAGFEGETLE